MSPRDHPLLEPIAALELPAAAGEEPGGHFDPVAPTLPSPTCTPAALLESLGEPGDPGLPTVSADDPLPPPPPGVSETARRVDAGELDPVDLIEAALQRIGRLGPDLGCFVTITAEAARRRAERLRAGIRAGETSPVLAGVPIAHKDLLLTAGVATRAGSALLDRCVPGDDATVVTALRDAGAVSLGKVETHEFATGITGLVTAHPPTRNPWDPERVPGGSSCGSAVAVAAGLVAGATGTDTGGSIRIPAACCGVVGFKPSYGLVSRDGVIPFSWSLDHVGPIARSVADAARLFDAMLGTGDGSRGSIGQIATDPGTIRFSLPEVFLRQATTEVAGAVADVADELEALGATRVHANLPAVHGSVVGIAAAIFLAEGYAVHAATLGRHAAAYQPETREFLGLGARISAERYLTALRLRTRLRDGIARAMTAADVILLPTLPIVAPRIAADEVTIDGEAIPVRAALTRFTRLANLTGQPALSLPCGTGRPPPGLQLLGRAGDDAALLAAATVVERICGGTRWPDGRESGDRA